MQTRPRPRILFYQSIGFLTIIALAWLDKAVGVSAVIFGDHINISTFHQAALVTLFTLGVWYLVASHTRRMLERFKYIEGFLRVCAWCRRIDHNGKWLPIEDFMRQSLQAPTTHGICEECAEVEIMRARKISATPTPVSRKNGV